MAIVGRDGNNAPERIEGLPAYIWLGVQARAQMGYGRQVDDPDFGLGLIDGLRGNEVSRSEWRRRLERSFAPYPEVQASVRVGGGSVSLEVSFVGRRDGNAT